MDVHVRRQLVQQHIPTVQKCRTRGSGDRGDILLQLAQRDQLCVHIIHAPLRFVLNTVADAFNRIGHFRNACSKGATGFQNDTA